MPYGEIVVDWSEICTELRAGLSGQNVEFFNIKDGGTYSDHWDVKGWASEWY